jgi:acetoin:2,6-dichlorophenolindophenol oxidoreductase subunit alpha
VTAVYPPSGDGPGSGAPPDWRDLLEAMWRIRYFEDEVRSLFLKGVVRGSTHLGQGQEAVYVGVCTSLREGDTATCTYRGHGTVLAMGAPLDRAFGEILGRAGGLCGGKGGSMHLADLSVGALGSNAIVGAHLPMTVGAALAYQYLGSRAVSVAFFGDGATNIGAFHESCNLAAVWRLPAIFVIENNHYGEYSPLSATTPVERLADRAASYGMPGRCVDGNDVTAVRDVTSEAVKRARAGDGPTLIEADTYRQQGHSRSDPGAYRPPGELEAWIANDPITRLENAVERDGLADRETLASLAGAVLSEVKAALEVALAWPEPDAAAGREDVFA